VVATAETTDREGMGKTVSISPAAGIQRPKKPKPGRARWALIILELATGTAAVVGGTLLIAAPDGSLLRADPSVLAGTTFTNWRVPGLLLATLVGGGYLLAGGSHWGNWRHARELSIFAGAGLMTFEAAELAWLGFQPLEAICAGIGLAVIALAWRTGKKKRPCPIP
jgi:hypothetical protein